MKKLVIERLLIVSAISLALGACSAKGGGRARYNETIDWNKVQRIDAAALTSNVKVIWVNPPQKKNKEN